jgi:glycosyltransferase involved in cell wall biosynthesis
MDYMGIGRPVITTALPEIEKLVGDCGLYIRRYDENELSEKIIEAISNPVMMKEMGEAARKRIKRQGSWLIMGKKLERIYCQYLNSSETSS